MGAPKIFNLAIKVNDRESKTTMNSVGKDLKTLRAYTRNLEEGTDKWREANKKLAEAEKTYDGMKKKQREFINQTKEATDETGNNKKAIQDFGQSFGQVTAGIMSGDLIMVQEGLRGMRAGIIGATKASLAFIATPLGMVLAGIALAVGALTQYFRDSEEGQNAWNKVTAVTGAIVGNLTDLLSDLGSMLIKVFSDPKQTLIDLKDSIVTNIENRITGLIKFFPRLGEAIELALSGKFTEAGKVASDAVLQITTGVEGATGKIAAGFDKAGNAVKNFGKEVANEADRAAELANMEAKADKIERALIIERGKVEAQVAEARLKARDEDKYSAQERKKFLEEAVSLQNNLLDKEIQAAGIRAQIKTEQNSFSKSTKDDLDEEARLIAKVDQLRRQKAEAERTMVRDQLRVDGELKKARGGGSGTSEEEKRLQEIDKLQADYDKKKLDRLADTALKESELERDRAIKKAEALGATQALLDQINAEHQIKIDEARAAEEEKELEALRAFDERKRALENELRLAKAESDEERAEIQKEIDLEKAELEHEKKLEQFEKEMEMLNLNEEEKAQVLAALEEAKQNTILGIQKKFTDQKIKDEERLSAAKKKLMNDSLDAAINLAGQESKIGQMLLLAKQIMAAKEMAIELGLFSSKMQLNVAEASADGAKGQMKTAASQPFPWNIPLILGFAAQVGGIISTIKGVANAKSGVKKSFARGGFTDMFGLGYTDETGHEPAGIVHKNEYVVPEFMRKEPEVPQILNYLETKRKKKLGLYASGGDPEGSDQLPSTNVIGQSGGDARQLVLLQAILEAIDVTGDFYFGYEAEEKRQEAQKKLDAIKQRSKIKKE